MSDTYIHYRFDINFTENASSPYTFFDMSGYFRYDQSSKTIIKMNNGSSKLKNPDGTMVDQLFEVGDGVSIGGVIPDNKLYSDSEKTTMMTSTPPNNTSSAYIDLDSQPDFYFGKLFLANTFITMYLKDGSENVAQRWYLSSSSDNHITLKFTKGSGTIWNSIDSYTSYTITFTQVSGLNPTPPNCFIEGSKIYACVNEKLSYVPIETLRVGDLIKTRLHGSRKIKYIGKNYIKNVPTVWNECVCIATSQTLPELSENLLVTGGHSILVDSLSEIEREKQLKIYGDAERKIDGKYKVTAWASEKFNVINDDKKYVYYHLVLENDGNVNKQYGIWCNGILTESQCEKHFLAREYIPLV